MITVSEFRSAAHDNTSGSDCETPERRNTISVNKDY